MNAATTEGSHEKFFHERGLIIVERGNITTEGSHENLMARRGVYYNLSTNAAA